MVARSLSCAQLPPELTVDMTDRSRGIRITLTRSTSGGVSRHDGGPVDCAGAVHADTEIRSLDYAIVDVETTGGSWLGGHRITEIAAVRLTGRGLVIDEYRSLVNPDRPIPPVISRLTGITPDMLWSAPRFDEILPAVARVLRGAVFVAHNAAFDWRFVSAELDRSGVPLTGSTLCTVSMARKLVPEVRSKSLDSLSWFFNIPNAARHRAYGDAAATAEVFRRLMHRLEDQEVTRWNELQTLLARRAKRKKRRANPQPMSDA